MVDCARCRVIPQTKEFHDHRRHSFRVREASDIVEVIGEHVPLKRAGKDFKGLCPFHQEKTPRSW